MHSPHLFSGFLRCGVCGGAITTVTGGHGSPRYGCMRAWKNGRTACANRLTIRAKVADPALLSGLRDELLRPETVQYVTEGISARLNRVIDQRPASRERSQAALQEAQRRLANLVAAIEGGAALPSLVEAVRTREAEIARLRTELDDLSEPVQEKAGGDAHVGTSATRGHRVAACGSA